MSPAEIHADAVAHFARLRRVRARLQHRWWLAHLRHDEAAVTLYAAAAHALGERLADAARDMREAADALLAARGGRPLIP